MPLTDVKIRQAKPSEKVQKLADGGALYLVIKPNGAKLWWYRYVLGGKENVYSIGEYPTVSLVDARRARDDAKLLVKAGKQPGHARAADRRKEIAKSANTFRGVAEELLELKAVSCTAGYVKQIRDAFENHAYPAIGKLPIADVKPAHLLGIFRPMQKKGIHVMAENIRQWSSQVFRHAIITQRAEFDPAAVLVGVIGRPPVKHARALTEDEIRQFWLRLDRYQGHTQTKIALQLMAYSFVRTIEIRRAEWKDLNLEGAVWNIEAGKMKMRRHHIVPLSRQAVALLRKLDILNGNNRLMFPNTRRPDAAIPTTTLNRALTYLGFDGQESEVVSGHDFRATASTYLHEMGFRPDHIELQLAHVENDKTKAAYNHAQYMVERRQMMQKWADWLDGFRE